jgi:hypothetical protein
MNQYTISHTDTTKHTPSIEELFIELERSAKRFGIHCDIIQDILNEDNLSQVEFIQEHFDEILDIVKQISGFYTEEAKQRKKTNDSVHAIMSHSIIEKAQFTLWINFVKWFLNYLRENAITVMHDESQVKHIFHMEKLDDIKSEITILYEMIDDWHIKDWNDFRNYLDSLRNRIHSIKNEVALLNEWLKWSKKPTEPESKESEQPKVAQSNIINFPGRVRAWQWLPFTSQWWFASKQTVQETRKKIREWLTEWVEWVEISWFVGKDIQAANDEFYPDSEMSDDMIQRALKSARLRKDWGILQSIENNLVKKAYSKMEQWGNREYSLHLTDHVQNATPENPIQVRTLEYKQFDILKLDKVIYEWARDTYYKAQIRIQTHQMSEPVIENVIINAERFCVGDFSSKIVWNITKEWKFIKSNISCTVRDIESNKKTWSGRFLWKVKSSVSKIWSWFGGGNK